MSRHTLCRSALKFVVVVSMLITGTAAAMTCPFNIPVVTLAPQQVAGFSWGSVIRPMGDACIEALEVDPTNDKALYVGSATALYQTKDGGATWTKPLNGHFSVILVVPSRPQLIYAATGAQLYLSRDSGGTWTLIHTFPKPVRSLLVNGATLFAGLGWDNHINPSGVFVSNLGAGLMTFHAFGPGQTGLIVWTLSRDPLSGMIYAGTEIFDHPQPYHPPFFRSPNNGVNWFNVAGTLPSHVIDSDVRPGNGYLYALTEGYAVFGSTNQGGNWIPPAQSLGLGGTLLMDPKTPTRLFVGRQKTGTLTGGIFRSTDSGKTYQSIGLQGVTVSDVAVNGAVKRIYAATYASGIYTSPIP